MPPGVASVRVVVAPTHTLGVPAIAATIGPLPEVSVAAATVVQPDPLVTL